MKVTATVLKRVQLKFGSSKVTIHTVNVNPPRLGLRLEHNDDSDSELQTLIHEPICNTFHNAAGDC